MVKIDMRSFKSVEFKTNVLTIKSGGSLNKEWAVESKEVRHEAASGAAAATFVLIRSREPWLTHAVLGKSNRGEMINGVVQDLRDNVYELEQRIRSGLPATNGIPDTTPDDEETDPMDEMEVMD